MKKLLLLLLCVPLIFSCEYNEQDKKINILEEKIDELEERIDELVDKEEIDPQKQGYTITESGLAYKVIKRVGHRKDKPLPTADVYVLYTGKLEDGTIFDSSVERGEPSRFRLDQVIPGWTEGLQLMSIGDKFEFIIPGNLAFGQSGNPSAGIGPNATLIFEIELLDIV